MILLLSAIMFQACKKDKKTETVKPEETLEENQEDPEKPDEPYILNLPAGFTYPLIPEDNKLTQNRVALGKKLFFDPILSKDHSVSCGSCHLPTSSFTDNTQFSIGVNGAKGTRNSMPLINLAWASSFFWDGGVPSLELQVIAPITNHLEMALTMEEAVQRLKDHPEYPSLFKKAYNREPDQFSLTRAIAAFERTLISGNSRFDQYFYQGKADALNESEIRGLNLFFGNDLHCASCHNGVHFTNGTFQNNGLYRNYADQGRFLITSNYSDVGKFKVPTLRNIALTAPYMHDGSLKTLEEVLAHYESGGRRHPNQSPHVHKHEPLTNQQKQDLINFLNSLTDESFINNEEFKPSN